MSPVNPNAIKVAPCWFKKFENIVKDNNNMSINTIGIVTLLRKSW